MQVSCTTEIGDVDTFIEELTKDRAHVWRRIVRVARLIKPVRGMPISSCSVVATVIIHHPGANIFELVKYIERVGDLWNMDNDKQVNARAEECVAKLTAAVQKLD